MAMFYFINKKVIILFFTLFTTTHILVSQETSNFWEYTRYGGEIGLNFSNNYFSASIAPSALYKFNNTLSLGLGLSATINRQKNIYKSTILGGRLIGLFNVINEIQLSVEFEELHVNRTYNSNLDLKNDTYWTPALFIGAGYRNGNITFGVKYDVLHDINKSVYADSWVPFVRVYF